MFFQENIIIYSIIFFEIQCKLGGSERVQFCVFVSILFVVCTIYRIIKTIHKLNPSLDWQAVPLIVIKMQKMLQVLCRKSLANTFKMLIAQVK